MMRTLDKTRVFFIQLVFSHFFSFFFNVGFPFVLFLYLLLTMCYLHILCCQDYVRQYSVVIELLNLLVYISLFSRCFSHVVFTFGKSCFFLFFIPLSNIFITLFFVGYCKTLTFLHLIAASRRDIISNLAVSHILIRMHSVL